MTALAERLSADGYITRTASPHDRRVQIVRLTEEGRRRFRRMAKKHGTWVASLFGGLPGGDVEDLMTRLGRLKNAVRSNGQGGG